MSGSTSHWSTASSLGHSIELGERLALWIGVMHFHYILSISEGMLFKVSLDVRPRRRRTVNNSNRKSQGTSGGISIATFTSINHEP